MLDPLHIALIATTGLVSILFSVIAFFIARDFKKRDEHDTQLLGAINNLASQLGEYKSELAVVKVRVEANSQEIDRLRDTTHSLRDELNVVRGRAG